jgi:hypothetical protein
MPTIRYGRLGASGSVFTESPTVNSESVFTDRSTGTTYGGSELDGPLFTEPATAAVWIAKVVEKVAASTVS